MKVTLLMIITAFFFSFPTYGADENPRTESPHEFSRDDTASPSSWMNGVTYFSFVPKDNQSTTPMTLKRTPHGTTLEINYLCEKPTTTIICNTINLLEVLSQANPDDFGMSVISAAASMYSSQPLDETIGYHLFLETLNSLKAFGILLEEVHLLSPPPDLGAGDDSIET